MTRRAVSGLMLRGEAARTLTGEIMEELVMEQRIRQARNVVGEIKVRMLLLASDESGMTTVEYAIGTVAAAAFGAILYTVVTGDSIVSALNRVIGRALSTKV